MGNDLIDQYSILHFSVGVITYFWQIPFLLGFIGHLIFEYFENTPQGMNIINKYFVRENTILRWPGGKDKPDSFLNSMIGDNLFYALGWIISKVLDVYYN
jgi:hypothetical protein